MNCPVSRKNEKRDAIFFAGTADERDLFELHRFGAQIAGLPAMSSFDSIYKKMASSLEPGEGGKFHETHTLGARHVSPLVAHELNNILTIIQGYADRLLLRHGENEALQPHLKLISEAARRAATIVHEATPSSPPANRKGAPAPLVNA